MDMFVGGGDKRLEWLEGEKGLPVRLCSPWLPPEPLLAAESSD